MALADLTDPEAVEQAMAEFDERGREPFLDAYGFAPARDYFVVADGRRYDSKAIVGVAHLQSARRPHDRRDVLRRRQHRGDAPREARLRGHPPR